MQRLSYQYPNPFNIKSLPVKEDLITLTLYKLGYKWTVSEIDGKRCLNLEISYKDLLRIKSTLIRIFKNYNIPFQDIFSKDSNED